MVLVCVVASASAVCAQGAAGDSSERVRVQALADQFRARLDILAVVEVTMVAANPLLLSVEPLNEGPERFFQLKVEEDFVRGLSDADLAAAVAHELGHVWIFTHHPFLHTEQLANEIAMRVVSRGALAQLYEQVWSRRGTTGDLVRFLGPQPEAGLASSDDRQP